VDWFENDDLFFAELAKGHQYAAEVCRRLKILGIDASVPPRSKRIHVDDRDLYDDETDIIIPGTPPYTIEVKSRDLSFNCAHDFPYDTAFVDTVSGWNHKHPKPIAVILVSQATLGLAVIKGSTRPAWTIQESFDNVRHISDRFYMVPREHLVGFDTLVIWLKKKGRLAEVFSGQPK
jgi:hypothetical protein